MRFSDIIPAPYTSTCFPAELLAKLRGKPVIQRVYEQVKNNPDEVLLLQVIYK